MTFGRPTWNKTFRHREDLLSSAEELFDVLRSGAVRVEIGQTYALKDAARAHQELEARKTKASSLLIP